MLERSDFPNKAPKSPHAVIDSLAAVKSAPLKEPPKVGHPTSMKRKHGSEPVNAVAANSGNPAKKRKGKKSKVHVPALSESQEASIQVHPRIVCHNCGREGHESGDCMADRACLNCKQIDHDLKDCRRAKQCTVCQGSDHISVSCPLLDGKHRHEYSGNLAKPKIDEGKVVVDAKLPLKVKQESKELTARLHEIPAHEKHHEKPKTAKEKKDMEKRLQEIQANLDKFTAYQEHYEKREQKVKNKPKVDKPTETKSTVTVSPFGRDVPTKNVLDLASTKKGSASKLKPTENSQHEDSSQERSRVADIKPTNFIRRLTSMEASPIVPPKHSLRLERDVTNTSPSPTARPRATPRTITPVKIYDSSSSSKSEIEELKAKKPGVILPPTAKKETRILPPSAKKETPIPPPKSLSSRDAIRPASKPASTPKTATSAAKLGTSPLTKKETPIPPPARKTSGATPPTWIKKSLAKTNSAIKASRQNDKAWNGNVLPSSLTGMSRAGGEEKKIGDSLEEKSLRVTPDDWEKTPGRVRGNVGGDDADVQENIAFSATYLSTRPAGVKISNNTFRTLRIAATSPALAPPTLDAGELMLCFVSEGKVHVRLGDTTFSVSKGGMWRIRGGEMCEVRHGGKGVKDAVIFGVQCRS